MTIFINLEIRELQARNIVARFVCDRDVKNNEIGVHPHDFIGLLSVRNRRKE